MTPLPRSPAAGGRILPEMLLSGSARRFCSSSVARTRRFSTVTGARSPDSRSQRSWRSCRVQRISSRNRARSKPWSFSPPTGSRRIAEGGHRHGGMLARDCRIASIQSGKAMSALVREHPARSCEDRSASIVLLARQSHPQPAAVASCPVAANRWITAASRCQHHSENPPRAGPRRHARLRSLTDIIASQSGALILRIRHRGDCAFAERPRP
jgi:hypothetical protein